MYKILSGSNEDIEYLLTDDSFLRWINAEAGLLDIPIIREGDTITFGE